jgi:hypothetical protein
MQIQDSLMDKKQKTTRSRFNHGMVMATRKRIVKIRYEDAWLVESETVNNKFYKVTEDGQCECPDFQTRGLTCKHMWALIRSELNSQIQSAR